MSSPAPIPTIINTAGTPWPEPPFDPVHLLPAVTAFVRRYMANYDGSHDFAHIQRVLGLAHTLRLDNPSRYNATIVSLCALLHDVGDKKYLLPGQDAEKAVEEVLLNLGASEAVAGRVQEICSAVSYSSEIKPGGAEHVKNVIEKYPELEVVQDADRLDAIGAVGMGRCFAFGGAKGRTLQNSIEHFEEKLVRLEGMMKTEKGKEMAKERTERIGDVMRWWEAENADAAKGREGLDFLTHLQYQ